MKLIQFRRYIWNYFTAIGLALSLAGVSAATRSQENPSSLEAYLHYDTDLFSASPAKLKVTVEKRVDCAALDFTLFQRAAVLASPVTLEEDVKCEIVAAENHATQIALSFRSPRVEKRLSFVWVIAACHTDRERCEELSTTPFQVYPDNLLAPLNAWSSANILRVNDTSGTIEALLDNKKIEYLPTLSAPVRASKETQVLTLLHEENERQLSTQIEQGLQYGDVIAFKVMHDSDQMIDALPMVYLQRDKNALTSITLPLLPYLQEGPRAQSIFMELFHLTVN